MILSIKLLCLENPQPGMDPKSRRVTDTGLSCSPTSCSPTLYKLMTLLKFRGQKVNNSPTCWELIKVSLGAFQTPCYVLPSAPWGADTSLFGPFWHQPPDSLLLHCSSVVGLEQNVEIEYPYSNSNSIPSVPMHLSTFLACASAISLSCLKAKVQSLPPQAEVVPLSSDGSISSMGITKSHFAAH